MWKIIHVCTYIRTHTYSTHTQTQTQTNEVSIQANAKKKLSIHKYWGFETHQKILSTYLLHSGFIHTIVARRHEVCFHSIGKRQTLITECMGLGSTIWLRNECESSVCVCVRARALEIVFHVGCHFCRCYLMFFFLRALILCKCACVFVCVHLIMHRAN